MNISPINQSIRSFGNKINSNNNASFKNRSCDKLNIRDTFGRLPIDPEYISQNELKSIAQNNCYAVGMLMDNTDYKTGMKYYERWHGEIHLGEKMLYILNSAKLNKKLDINEESFNKSSASKILMNMSAEDKGILLSSADENGNTLAHLVSADEIKILAAYAPQQLKMSLSIRNKAGKLPLDSDYADFEKSKFISKLMAQHTESKTKNHYSSWFSRPTLL